MEKTPEQINNRRYKLHYKLRKAGYKVHTAMRTIEVPAYEFVNRTTPEPYSRYFKELMALNYGIQSTIK